VAIRLDPGARVVTPDGPGTVTEVTTGDVTHEVADAPWVYGTGVPPVFYTVALDSGESGLFAAGDVIAVSAFDAGVADAAQDRPLDPAEARTVARQAARSRRTPRK
jgi:hypothetical protein